MSDDSFFREVSEELRQDRVRALWTRFGKWIIAAVVLVILLTIGYVVWERWQAAAANASGDRFLAAIDLAAAGETEEAIAQLQALADEGYGAYPALAAMRIGTIRHAAGEDQAAVEAFDRIAADESVPQPIRDMAAVRAAYVLVDSGTLEEVRARVEGLSGDSEPLRFAAREALGLAAWKAGDMEAARGYFTALRDDQATPSGIAGRARLMLDVIAAREGATGETAAPPQGETEAAAEPAAAGETAPAGAVEAEGEASGEALPPS